MKYCIFFFSLMIAANVKAQSKFRVDSLTLYHHNFNHNNTFLESQRTVLPQRDVNTNSQQLNTDNSVLKLPAPKLTYIGTSNSFDIYKATPDNMPVAKPDDTIAFNMPVACKATK
jgi:hypothetical protein